ncbi:TIGR03915 family putative DNA repair protein [Paenibacillus glufosinatiresistens]|uniref:TIGR03915 family putative DNA repair protein n=1 Tax=Paenibacillus glufosinatiresistens TaxID=3070657 RepID=UPI00286D9F05|nr:TIGR03915 family putative DNA repair protein [Paenibacillus sp. YX.27]
MFKTAALAYSYDGSFEGLLSCVFESYVWKETPLAIHPQDDGPGLLLESKWIETDPEHAGRVLRSIPQRIGAKAEELVRLGFCTCLPDKELLLLKFLQLGFAHGPRVLDMLADDTVDALVKAVLHLRRESHRYLGLIRFSVYGPVIAAVIEPRNLVLPLIRDHFCDRFGGERFMIYDAAHRMALIHEPGRSAIIPLEAWTPPQPDETEERYRRLWKGFYEAIGIKERRNERLRISNMPKRYWKELTEMDGGGWGAAVARSRARSASPSAPGGAGGAPTAESLPAPGGSGD